MMVGQCAALFVCLFHMQMLKANQISGILFITDMLYHLQCNAMQYYLWTTNCTSFERKNNKNKCLQCDAMRCNAMRCNAMLLNFIHSWSGLFLMWIIKLCAVHFAPCLSHTKPKTKRVSNCILFWILLHWHYWHHHLCMRFKLRVIWIACDDES